MFQLVNIHWNKPDRRYYQTTVSAGYANTTPMQQWWSYATAEKGPWMNTHSLRKMQVYISSGLGTLGKCSPSSLHLHPLNSDLESRERCFCLYAYRGINKFVITSDITFLTLHWVRADKLLTSRRTLSRSRADRFQPLEVGLPSSAFPQGLNFRHLNKYRLMN